MPQASQSSEDKILDNKNLYFDSVTILGVGLIGASLALALREKKLCGRIFGFGRREENLRRAKELGIINDYSLDPVEACIDSELIVLATPVGLFRDIVGDIKGFLKPGALITDVGSVKGPLVYELEAMLPEGVSFVGCHPIAGSEQSGIEDARSDLFRNALCVVTPGEKSDMKIVQSVALMWEGLGCRVEYMNPYTHDEIFSAVSHFPHMAAYALVNAVNDLDPGYLKYAGQGFRDTTRIAVSSPELWRDISLANRDNLLKLTELFIAELKKMRDLLESEDGPGLEKKFDRARKLREKLM
jgi:prephenate dehydrogenase